MNIGFYWENGTIKAQKTPSPDFGSFKETEEKFADVEVIDFLTVDPNNGPTKILIAACELPMGNPGSEEYDNSFCVTFERLLAQVYQMGFENGRKDAFVEERDLRKEGGHALGS